MAAKPLILCLPDICHPSHFFSRLKDALSLYSYPLIALDLPSLVLPGRVPTQDLGPDVEYIRSAILSYLISSYDIIVLLHGFAGVAGSEAILPEYGKDERQQRGLNGGVVRLLYVMSWLPVEGFQMCERGDVDALFPWVFCDLEVRRPPPTTIPYSPKLKPQKSKAPSLSTHLSPSPLYSTISHPRKPHIGRLSSSPIVWGSSGRRLATRLGDISPPRMCCVGMISV